MTDKKYRSTIASPFELEGIGIHTGTHSILSFVPEERDCGIVFVKEGVEIPASYEWAQKRPRCTVLAREGQEISTIEHLMSALWAFGIQDLKIEIKGGEVPILDGSAKLFWEKLVKVGRAEKEQVREELVLSEPFFVADGKSLVMAEPCERLEFHYYLHYDHPVLGSQKASFVPELDAYGKELAPARTFALRFEVEQLLASGLALGGTLDNALVVEDEGYSCPLRMPQEPAVHKCLDLVGDIALLGEIPRGRYVGICSGHRHNVELTQKIKEFVHG